jgi:hypothetical protein
LPGFHVAGWQHFSGESTSIEQTPTLAILPFEWKGFSGVIKSLSDSDTAAFLTIDEAHFVFYSIWIEDANQRNAALVEEAAAASASLREQAESLARAVGVFRLDGACAVEMAMPEPGSMPVQTEQPAELGVRSRLLTIQSDSLSVLPA